MQQAKKVLLLVGSLKTGGAERIAVNTAHALLAEGIEVYVVLQNNIIELPHQIPAERIIILNRDARAGKLAKLYNIVWKYFWTTVQLRPTHVLAFTRFSSFLATISFCSKIIGRYDVYPFALKWYKQLTSSWVVYWPFVQKVVVPSTGMLAAIRERGAWYRKKLHLIPNSIDAEFLNRQLNADNPYADQQPYIVAMGRLSYAKNYMLLLNAYAKSKVKATHRIVIIGDGPQRKQLQQLTSKLGLEDRVTYTGMLANPFPVVKGADFCVNPSHYESFCNVILESLMLEVPVVATNCDYGPADIIDDGVNGILIGNNDLEHLVQVLNDIADNKVDLANFRSNALASVEKFELERIREKWLELLNDV